MPVELGAFLTSTSYSLSLKDPNGVNIACDVQTFTHPSLSLPSAGNYATPRRHIPVPGDHIEFEPLNAQLIIDEDFTIYKTLADWITRNYTQVDETNFEDKMVDIQMHIRSGQGNKTITITYHNAFPTNIGSLNFMATDQGDDYLTFDVSFEFSHFTIA